VRAEHAYRMRGVHSSVSSRSRNSDTCLDGQADINWSLWVCGAGRGSLHKLGKPVSAGGGPVPSEPVWNSPQGKDHTVPARNGLTRSRAYGERPHSHGKCLLYRAGLASEVTAGQYLLIRSLPDSTVDFGVFGQSPIVCEST